MLRIESQRLQRILLIGVPIIGSMLSQSLINIVDAAMVGRLGDVALAAVGIGSYASFVMVSVVMGLSSAVQALISRRTGAGEQDRIHEPLMAGLLMSVVIAVPLSLLVMLLAPEIMALFSSEQSVVDLASPYFQWRSAALVAVSMNFVYRGYWSGIGDTREYLKTLLFMHLVNVVASYLLIFGIGSWQGLGAVGSGIGTAMALVFGTLLHTLKTFFHQREKLGHVTRPSADTLRQLGKLAWPNSAQQTLFAFGISMFFWIIGQIGTQEQAVGHIL
ncbi:MAG: MATE family efflux transporter, partial [Oceanobacter sp.]